MKVVVTAGNVQNQDGAKLLLEDFAKQEDLIQRLELICADGGYRGSLITWVEGTFSWKLEIVEKAEGCQRQLAYTENTWAGSSKPVQPNQPKRTRRDKTPSLASDKRNKNPKLKPNVPNRMYRRTRKKRADSDGQCWWRTRVDPFEKVWPVLEQRLAEQPEMSAKSLLEMLQQQYPNTFQDGQLRTLQRQVKQWRCDKMDEKINTENPYSISNEGDSG